MAARENTHNILNRSIQHTQNRSPRTEQYAP